MASSRSRQRRVAFTVLQSLLGRGARGLARLGFWAAIVLPALYLPLLAVGRVDHGLALVAAHAATVCLGQFHPRRA